MNIELYKIFLYTAREGNLTKTARKLHITQPSVSYAIKQLEKKLDLKLFHRQSKGVKLTTEGQALLEYVEQAFALLEAGERKMTDLKSLSSGELRIGASGPMIKHLLLPALDLFHEQHPGIRIRLSQEKSRRIQQQLLDSQIDIGLVHLPLSSDKLKVCHTINQQHIFVVGSNYRSYADRLLTAQDLNQLPLLTFSKESSTRQFIESWMHSLGIRMEVDIELGSMDMLIEFAKRGYGAAFVPRSFATIELENETLFELKLREPIPSRTISLVVRADLSLSASVEAFLHTLMTSLTHHDIA